jgi:4-carboxymuconolactone decarboxylase
MTDKEPSGAQKAFGDFAPTFVGYTDDVLFGQAWERPELAKRDRSLITVASLLTGGNTEQRYSTWPRPNAMASPKLN